MGSQPQYRIDTYAPEQYDRPELDLWTAVLERAIKDYEELPDYVAKEVVLREQRREWFSRTVRSRKRRYNQFIAENLDLWFERERKELFTFLFEDGVAQEHPDWRPNAKWILEISGIDNPDSALNTLRMRLRNHPTYYYQPDWRK